MVVLADHLARQDPLDPLASREHLVQRDLQGLPARQSKSPDRTDLLDLLDPLDLPDPMDHLAQMATLEPMDRKDLQESPAGTAHQANQVHLAKRDLKGSVEHQALATTVHHHEQLQAIKHEGCYWTLFCDPCVYFCVLSASYLAISR